MLKKKNSAYLFFVDVYIITSTKLLSIKSFQHHMIKKLYLDLLRLTFTEESFIFKE